MDDFHWLVAETHEGTNGYCDAVIHLVHKSAPLIRIGQAASLSEEAPSVKEVIQEIGGSFFAYCDEKILNRPTKSTQESTS